MSNDVAIIQASEAKKYQEPRKLAKIQIIPSKTSAQKGEKIRCRISGYDQFGDDFEVTTASMVAEGTIIDENGLLVCNETGKIFINASQSGITGTTTIEVFDPDVPGHGPTPASSTTQKVIWDGEVPSGKWMVFYNKVLAKHTSKSGFKVKVHFEFEVPNDDSQNTLEGIKTELSELGLKTE